MSSKERRSRARAWTSRTCLPGNTGYRSPDMNQSPCLRIETIVRNCENVKDKTVVNTRGVRGYRRFTPYVAIPLSRK